MKEKIIALIITVLYPAFSCLLTPHTSLQQPTLTLYDHFRSRNFLTFYGDIIRKYYLRTVYTPSHIYRLVKENLVIIPTYNEKENIGKIIPAVLKLDVDFDILIIDDNSPDGTAEIVKSLQVKYTDRLHLLSREGKLGLGTAYIKGFKWALERNYSYIFEMDADFSHNPKDLLRLL